MSGYSLTPAKRIARRYVLASTQPAQVWLAWVSVKDMTLEPTLRRLAEVQELVRSPLVAKTIRKVQMLADNTSWLTQHYDSTMLKFRGEPIWTRGLHELVEKLAKDKELIKHLTYEVSIDPDSLLNGVQSYFEQLSEEPSYQEVEHMVKIVGEYVDGAGSHQKAQRALTPLLQVSFSRQNEILRRALRVFPELEVKLIGEGSFHYFQNWLKQVAACLAHDPEETGHLLDSWEDALPIWLTAHEVVGQIDLSFLDGDRSAIYWYEEDLSRFADLLDRLFKANQA